MERIGRGRVGVGEVGKAETKIGEQDFVVDGGVNAPESSLDGLGLASRAARVLLAGLVEPGLHAGLPVLAEMVAVEDVAAEQERRVSCRSCPSLPFRTSRTNLARNPLLDTQGQQGSSTKAGHHLTLLWKVGSESTARNPGPLRKLSLRGESRVREPQLFRLGFTPTSFFSLASPFSFSFQEGPENAWVRPYPLSRSPL